MSDLEVELRVSLIRVELMRLAGALSETQPGIARILQYASNVLNLMRSA